MNLNHNKPNSMLRRIAGLSDAQWNSMIINVDIGVELNKTSFMIELIRFCVEKPEYHFILKLLGIKTNVPFEKLICETNFEHTNFRFFRHFCPEEIRNGIYTTGLSFATLVRLEKGYLWTAVKTIELWHQDSFLLLHGFNLDDEIQIIVSGINHIDTIVIMSEEKQYVHYLRKLKHKFGDKMWQLKNLIYKNKD
jgi:hypothetical protein